MKLIDKAAVVAEIKKRSKEWKYGSSIEAKYKKEECDDILSFLDTLEVKEVEEEFECPDIKIKDAIEVSSRMKHIDEDLKPVADFIMHYASWNLHSEEWNQPTLEVPLYRVLDALVQRGKPYCVEAKSTERRIDYRRFENE